MAKDFFTAEWFPYYWERFEESDQVALMSLTDEGAYHRAIRLAWNFRSLPADPELMAAKIQKRCTVKTAERVLRAFVPDPQNPRRVIHPVVEAIRAHQEQKYLNRRKGGIASRKGAKKSAPVTDANKGTLSITEECSSITPTRERVESREKDSFPNGKEEESLSLGDEAVAIYREVFPAASLSPYLQDLIGGRVSDAVRWRKTLSYWVGNAYRAQSVDKMLNCYDEKGYERQKNGTGKQRPTPNQTAVEDRVESIGLTEVQYLQ